MKKFRLNQRITSKETLSFTKYLEEIREIKQLSADEEYEIALKINDKNLTEAEREKAIVTLMNANLRFVVSVAKQYVSLENSLEDIVNEGNHGLVYAARRYDPKKGFKFITYAVWWIRRDIIAYINRFSRNVRLPNNKLALLSKIKSEADDIEQLLERTPTINDILEFGSGYTREEVIFYFESEKELSFSMDKPISIDESEAPLSDLFEDDTFGETDRLVNVNDSANNIEKMLGYLKNDQSRTVLTMLFGLDGGHSLTIKEVAEIMNLSSERIRQISVSSIKVLKNELKPN